MIIYLFASNWSIFEYCRHDEANVECVRMTSKDKIINKCKRNFLCEHKKNNRLCKANKLYNDDDVPLSLPMPHDDYNELTVK